jgi:hypothetical protein
MSSSANPAATTPELLSKELREKIIAELNKRGASKACGRCGHPNFILLDGYFNLPLSGNPTSFMLGGAAVPSVVIYCANCGAMYQHALGVLGLLPKSDNPT